MTNESAALYARSLYELAVDEGLDDRILNDLAVVEQLIRQNPDWLQVLSEPSIPRAKRLELLDEAFTGKLHDYTVHFLKLLCENSLIRDLLSCVREYRADWRTGHNIAEAVVTAAAPLSDAQCSALKDKLSAISGKQVELTVKTDARLLAGLRVELEGKQYELSAAGRLDAMRRSINGVVM